MNTPMCIYVIRLAVHFSLDIIPECIVFEKTVNLFEKW